jgi:GNAT superfamily N-acetyltransferase
MSDFHKLDNPVWHSLSETHQSFSVNYDSIKFYHPDYCPFGGFIKDNTIAPSIVNYSELVGNFFIVGDPPPVPAQLKLKNELVCLQMIIDKKIDIAIDERVALLGDHNREELAALVTLVQPGYFKSKTPDMGDYYGIFKNELLVAVTGERMQMQNFVEVSAVVSHPSHTGKGYAKQLVAHTVNAIFDKNKIPYLHVAETNTGAIALYKKLGFETRRNISFWNFSTPLETSH